MSEIETRIEISIHTPLPGSDVESQGVALRKRKISIHTPLPGSDEVPYLPALDVMISIHTPLPGSDIYVQVFLCPILYFNPHSPPGERQQSLRRRKAGL